MTILCTLGRMVSVAVLVATFLCGAGAIAHAEYLTLVACPAKHPFRADVSLRFGTTEGWDSKVGRFAGNGPLAIFARDGWAYQIDDDPTLVDDLVCVYADGSRVKYPLPDKSVRGTRRCDYVGPWDQGDITSDDDIVDWPPGLDRKPMAICTFDLFAKRTLPPKSN